MHLAQFLPWTKKLIRENRRLAERNATLKAQRDSARESRDRWRFQEERRREQGAQAGELWAHHFGAQFNLAMPPDEIQVNVGRPSPEFLMKGKLVADEARAILHRAGKEFGDFERVLDFGCGSGRVGRFFKSRGAERPEIHGCDIDAAAIQWCQESLRDVGTFQVSPAMPPAPYAADSFDLIFVYSVFTHLPEEMQDAWLADLRRMLRPGGLLLATIHGSDFERLVPESEKAGFRERGFYYGRFGKPDALPDFYQTAFHTHDYIRARWAEHFEIAGIFPRGIQTHDAVLCRKRVG